MPIIKNWDVRRLDAYPSYEGQDDVVFAIHWVVAATDGTYTADADGIVNIEYSSGDFTPLADLTKDQVMGWVYNSLGQYAIDAYENLVLDKLDAIVNPSVISVTPPWTS